jgi:hypothetical protein
MTTLIKQAVLATGRAVARRLPRTRHTTGALAIDGGSPVRNIRWRPGRRRQRPPRAMESFGRPGVP